MGDELGTVVGPDMLGWTMFDEQIGEDIDDIVRPEPPQRRHRQALTAMLVDDDNFLHSSRHNRLSLELDQFSQGGPAPAASSPPTSPSASGLPLASGLRLVREWQGTAHVVTVDDTGAIHWNGQRWKSLSEVARVITGTRWSGPAVFGLKQRKAAV
jgi:hypothetical protein